MPVTPFQQPRSLISIVVPLFNEQENLPELHRRLALALVEERNVEFVFVNDGSKDATASLLQELHARDSRVMVISLSRNFGHQAAISAGIDHASGEAVILMDGDLQDPPEVLPQFIAAWRQGSEVVYAVRTKRKEGLVKRCCYALFYRVFRAVSDLDIPLDSGDFCLMDRKVVDALKRLPERNRFVRGLRSFVGYRQTGLAYERAARQAGKPKYTFKALCRLALDGLIGFSSAPLSLVSQAGAGCLALAAVFGLTLVVQALQQNGIAGWAIVTAALFLCTGLQLCCLGIVAEYIRRIFLETKGRPTYVVAAIQQPRTDVYSTQDSSHPQAA
jgi:dolichol-phosphate mannosyltransferase